MTQGNSLTTKYIVLDVFNVSRSYHHCIHVLSFVSHSHLVWAVVSHHVQVVLRGVTHSGPQLLRALLGGSDRTRVLQRWRMGRLGNSVWCLTG
jgi:hypothetical protein